MTRKPAEYFWTMTIQWPTGISSSMTATSWRVATPEPDAGHCAMFEQAYDFMREKHNATGDCVVLHWHLAPEIPGKP